MGHSRYDSLPRTKQWREVVARFSRLDCTPEELIGSTLRAAEVGLRNSQGDPFVASSCWLLLQLPLLAQSNQLGDWLQRTGAPQTGDPRRDVLAGAGRFFEKLSFRKPFRNILSEVARLACLETLGGAFQAANLVLFGADNEEVRKSLSRYASPEGYRQLTGRFFQSFFKRALANLLEKELPNRVGVSERFSSLEDTAEFEKTLDGFCREETSLLSEYAHDWYAKNVIHRRPSEKAVGGFAAYAVKKLLEGLERERMST